MSVSCAIEKGVPARSPLVLVGLGKCPKCFREEYVEELSNLLKDLKSFGGAQLGRQNFSCTERRREITRKGNPYAKTIPDLANSPHLHRQQFFTGRRA